MKTSCDITAVGQPLFSDSLTPMHDLGARIITPDGRIFRYVRAGATALVPGKLQQAAAVVANHQNIAVNTAAAVGAKTVTVTLGATAATANQYAGGTLVVNDANGEGHSYTIKSHPAADSAGSLTLTLEDDESIIVALTTSSEVCLMPNIYNGVIVNPTTPTNVPVGVAIYPITATYYGWIQTRGAVACLNDSNTAVGLGVSPSQSVAGSVKTAAATLHVVGSALQAGVDTEYRTIYLQLE